MPDVWSYEGGDVDAGGADYCWVLLNGSRLCVMSKARAVGLVAAMSTPEAQAAFKAARDTYNAGRSDRA